MKPRLLINRIILLLWMSNLAAYSAYAQPADCVLLPPAITIDFGAGNIHDVNLYRLPKYERDFTTCPKDGYYSFVSHTSNCFNNDWLTFNSDHTSNDGNMMLVNASETGGIFFNTIVDGLKPNTTYQFGVWMVNVCRINGGCSPLPPNISLRLYAQSGKKVAGFITGVLSQKDVPQWKKFFGYFVTPPDVSSLTIIMEDITLGGCGNDFAMDDITFSECVKPQPVVQPKPVLADKDIKKPSTTKIEKKKLTIKAKSPTKEMPVLSREKPMPDLPVTLQASVDEKPITKTIPQPILTRDNPVIKRIETAPGKIMIDLYDNGEIDGDTVSIYDNNEIMISHAGLSDKPIHFEVTVDAAKPHHELIMVANNLGSIPPNTSLMIITANGKRYEVHISSSEQKNAKVQIDLKE